jgi:hypothetical protein
VLIGLMVAGRNLLMGETMVKRVIEIHDSVLERILLTDRSVQLHFSSVYIHPSDGRPGIDADSGWVQRAILHIDGPEVEGAFSEFPVDLADGQICLGEYRGDNEIPIPLHFKGAFTLRLDAMWRPHEVVTFRGSGAVLKLIGEPEYVEEFQPNE